jgi:hypothetical protein
MSGRITSQGHEVKVNPHILAVLTPDAHQSSCILPLPALSLASPKKRTVAGYHAARRDAKCLWNLFGESEGKRNDIIRRMLLKWSLKKCVARALTGLIWLMIRTVVGVVNLVMKTSGPVIGGVC